MDGAVEALRCFAGSHSRAAAMLRVSKQAVSAWVTGVTPVPPAMELLATLLLEREAQRAAELPAGLPGAPPDATTAPRSRRTAADGSKSVRLTRKRRRTADAG